MGGKQVAIGRAAGSFSEWLRDAEASLLAGKGDTNVPCGTCTACCRSSMFIHISPEETRTLQRIPPALLFPAPGRPKGHMVMGYNDRGHCPMLVDNKCSIYEDRPQTCRSYDCRVFTATGVPVDQQTQPDIAQRVQEWAFHYESKESRKKHTTLKEAAAVRIQGLFSELKEGTAAEAIADAIMKKWPDGVVQLATGPS
jgi:uncharacterized protein